MRSQTTTTTMASPAPAGDVPGFLGPTEVLPQFPSAPPSEATTPAPSPTANERFEAIYERYGKLIGAIVGKVGRRLGWRRDTLRASLLQDIEQEVLLDIWKQVCRGQTIAFPTSYIYTAAYRETLRILRREASREMEPIDEDSPANQVPAVGDPYHAFLAKEAIREVAHGLRRMAPDRAAAVRAHLAGFGLQEVMVQQGWSYQKARNLLFRGMEDLRQSLIAGLFGATSPEKQP